MGDRILRQVGCSMNVQLLHDTGLMELHRLHRHVEDRGDHFCAAAFGDKLQDFVKLVEEKRRLEAELRTIQDQINFLEPILLEHLALAGMTSATVNGYTVYKAREFTASIKPNLDKPTVLKEFIEAGYGNLAMLGWQSLRGIVREASESGEPLPDVIERSCDIGEVARLRTRKA